MPGEAPVRHPVLFLGHGSPMNAIEDNSWARAFRRLGEQLPRPRAILAVSAHWYVPETLVTANDAPETIHDFGGFPAALYAMQYPAPGDPALAARVAGLLGRGPAALSTEWGLDHGTWSVLVHLCPAADIPVVQLSVNASLAPSQHLALGAALAPLRDEGVLILGSGNIVHNLRDAIRHMGERDVPTPDWAARFDETVAAALQAHDLEALGACIETPDGRTSHPTLDHYLPLLYAAAAGSSDDAVSFPITGFDMGSLSMRAVRIG